MTFKKDGPVLEHRQLFVLALVHFTADMMGNFLPSIMPAVQDFFKISLMMGTGILFAYYFVHNGLQVFIGHLRQDKNRPLFLPIGICLCGALCFISILTGIRFAYPLILIGAVIGASGIAMMHTEGLRALHSLTALPPSVSTAYFMCGGFLGAAFGQWASALLVEKQGLKGLLWLLPLPVIVLVLFRIFRIRLAVDDGRNENNNGDEERYPFVQVFSMALVSAVGAFMLLWFVPQRLNELGFSLGFGGFSLMMFTLASAAGSFYWGRLAHRKGHLSCTLYALSVNLPLIILYLALIDKAWAVVFISVIGFFGAGAYVVMVTMARQAVGLKIGQRMGLLVGGTWAVAGAVALVVAKFLNSAMLLNLSPVCYIISLIIGLWIYGKNKKRSFAV